VRSGNPHMHYNTKNGRYLTLVQMLNDHVRPLAIYTPTFFANMHRVSF